MGRACDARSVLGQLGQLLVQTNAGHRVLINVINVTVPVSTVLYYISTVSSSSSQSLAAGRWQRNDQPLLFIRHLCGRGTRVPPWQESRKNKGTDRLMNKIIQKALLKLRDY
jgi:hypothetical protein